MKHTPTSNAIGGVIGLSMLALASWTILGGEAEPEPEPAVATDDAAPPRPEPDPMPEVTKPPVHLGLGYLSGQLRDNEHATMEELRGAEVIVNAVHDRAIRMGDHYALTLQDRLSRAKATARMLPTEDAAVAALGSGQEVTVRCRQVGTGWDGIALKGCTMGSGE